MREWNENNFDAALGEGKIVLVDFWASWCGPCRMMAPILEEFDKAHPEITVGKVNVDDCPVLADRFAIEAIPTLIFFKNGEPVKKKTGVYPADALELILKEVAE